uniref:Uncharacterized protein n=1 Tax=Guillardia theta TaxID=55529 RepID=A0A6U5X959_GUITH|mmetsp:Transcript_17322/g.57377  ORF Transcript_17322/g.57377 Transcript_17322/m.57377 type:complete len:110 (+) Transcript_17322:286-615(+)
MDVWSNLGISSSRRRELQGEASQQVAELSERREARAHRNRNPSPADEDPSGSSLLQEQFTRGGFYKRNRRVILVEYNPLEAACLHARTGASSLRESKASFRGPEGMVNI